MQKGYPGLLPTCKSRAARSIVKKSTRLRQSVDHDRAIKMTIYGLESIGLPYHHPASKRGSWPPPVPATPHSRALEPSTIQSAKVQDMLATTV